MRTSIFSIFLIVGLISNVLGQEKTKEKRDFIVQKSALNYNNGYIPLDLKLEKDGPTLSQENDVLKIQLNGTKKNLLYKELEGLDFRGKLAIKIDAKVIGEENVKLRLRMTDAHGLVTNGKDIDRTVVPSNDYKPYFFRLKGAFIQTFPDLKNVNGADIRKLGFIISPTGKGSNSTLEIRSIKIVTDDEVYKTAKLGKAGAEGRTIVGQDTPYQEKVWSTDSKYTLASVGNELVITADAVGIRYEKLSTSFDLTSGTKLKIVAKYEGDVQPFIRFDFVDVNGFVTNRKPGMVRLQPGGYQEYIIDFSDRARQSYPKQVDVDLSRIVKIDCYVDPAYLPFTGTIYIQSIEIK